MDSLPGDSSFSHSSSFSDSSSVSSEESIVGDIIVPYDKEPEWTEEELATGKSDAPDGGADDSDEDEHDWASWPPADRLGNTDWCQCGECLSSANVRDCVCCWDYADCVQKIDESGQKCITAHGDFHVICTHPAVLSTALKGFLDMTKQPLDTQFENKSLRYASYRQFTWWVHGRLGKNVRLVIPSCALNIIRLEFPNPPGEAYVGFEEPNGDD